MSALAFAVSVSLGAPIAAQDTPAAQRSELTESILAAKERALGERFDASIRASLKTRMEALSVEQLNSLAQQGDTADLPSLLAAVPGGQGNSARGDWSFAAGRFATVGATDAGTFVWADTSGGGFFSTGPNQFLVRAAGGVGINKDNPGSALDVNGSITATGLALATPLAVPQGGTGSATQNFVDLTTAQTVGGDKTLTGNLGMISSTATAGNIMKGSNRFIHNFGSQNTFSGENAGNPSGMTGSSNVANGFDALSTSGLIGNYNTAVGAFALRVNTAGAQSTATGAGALFTNVSGNSNTAAGGDALFNNTGSRNIAVGAGAGISLTTGDYNIDIGNAGVAGEGATIRIGDANQTSTFIAGISGQAYGTGVAVFVNSAGKLGTTTSSRRFKDTIADMDSASSALMRLRPVTFHYKADQKRALQYGLIAEEVAEVYPGLIAHSADGQIETVMYQFLPPMLLNEYQKQQRTIQAQATDLKVQTRRIADLEESRRALVADLISLKGAIGRIAELEAQAARVAALLQDLTQASGSSPATSTPKPEDQHRE